MREIKFRIWDGKKFHYTPGFNMHFSDSGIIVSTKAGGMIFSNSDNELQQFTGLKDKNKPVPSCIYEGDIVSLSGEVIGNKHDTPEIHEKKTNLLIEGIGTKHWRATEKEAMDRGCYYPV